jgi:hypothetical protein
MYVFDIKKYPYYKKRNLELINYGSNVLHLLTFKTPSLA